MMSKFGPRHIALNQIGSLIIQKYVKNLLLRTSLWFFLNLN